MFVRPSIERTSEGDFRLRLSNEERELLRAVTGELLGLLGAEPGDPALRRLFPPAYEGDDESEAEYRRLVQLTLAGDIRIDVERVTLDGVPEAWGRQAAVPAAKLVVVP